MLRREVRVFGLDDYVGYVSIGAVIGVLIGEFILRRMVKQ